MRNLQVFASDFPGAGLPPPRTERDRLEERDRPRREDDRGERGRGHPGRDDVRGERADHEDRDRVHLRPELVPLPRARRRVGRPRGGHRERNEEIIHSWGDFAGKSRNGKEIRIEEK